MKSFQNLNIDPVLPQAPHPQQIFTYNTKTDFHNETDSKINCFTKAINQMLVKNSSLTNQENKFLQDLVWLNVEYKFNTLFNMMTITNIKSNLSSKPEFLSSIGEVLTQACCFYNIENERDFIDDWSESFYRSLSYYLDLKEENKEDSQITIALNSYVSVDEFILNKEYIMKNPWLIFIGIVLLKNFPLNGLF